MPPSQSNTDGLTDPTRVPYGNCESFPTEPFPEYEGSKAIIYRSADGKIVAGNFKESGKSILTYPCDEFFFVTNGWVRLSVHGGEIFTLRKGDVCYFCKGTTIDIECGDDYSNVAVFVDNEKVTLV